MLDEMDEIVETIKQINQKKLGFSDLFNQKEILDNIDFKKYGGGFLISPNFEKKFDYIHIFPHGGSYFPNEIKVFVKNFEVQKVAKLISENNDTATTSIAIKLINKLTKSSVSSCIAYFDLSRVLIDANRGLEKDQIKEKLYKGNSLFEVDSIKEISSILREKYLIPWVNEVNRIIKNNPNSIIFHHHTFDIKGARILPHDKEPFSYRPTAQFFQMKPIFNNKDEVIKYKGKFIEDNILKNILQWTEKVLIRITSEVEIRIDNPLIAPIMPFYGCTSSLSEDNNEQTHIIYELRKDIISNIESIEIWTEFIEDLQIKLKK